MPKYHINREEQVGPCRARLACPFGDLTQDHYATHHEAVQALDRELYEAFGGGVTPSAGDPLMQKLRLNDWPMAPVLPRPNIWDRQAMIAYNNAWAPYESQVEEVFEALRHEELTPEVFAAVVSSSQFQARYTSSDDYTPDKVGNKIAAALGANPHLNEAQVNMLMRDVDAGTALEQNPSLTAAQQLRFIKKQVPVGEYTAGHFVASRPDLTSDNMHAILDRKDNLAWPALTNRNDLPADVRARVLENPYVNTLRAALDWGRGVSGFVGEPAVSDSKTALTSAEIAHLYRHAQTSIRPYKGDYYYLEYSILKNPHTPREILEAIKANPANKTVAAEVAARLP